MRSTKIISTWPIAYPARSLYEGPICKDGKVIDWFCSWECVNRTFPIDMAAFAISLRVLLASGIYFNPRSIAGYMESEFLQKIVSLSDFEPKANCTDIYVWHTKTFDNSQVIHEKFNKFYNKAILDKV